MKARAVGACAAVVGVVLMTSVAAGQIPEPVWFAYLPEIGQAPTTTPTPVPTPAPTATPRPATLRVTNLYVSAGANAGDVVVLGILRNDTGAPLFLPSVNVVLRGHDGSIVNGGDSSSLDSFIKVSPDGKTPFALTLSHTPEGWSTYEITPRWLTNLDRVARLDPTRIENYFDGDGRFHARGYIRNPNAFDVTYPEAYIVLYNAAQQVIGTKSVALNSSKLAGMAELFFDSAVSWVGFPDRSLVASSEVWGYGSDIDPVTTATPVPTMPPTAVVGEPTPLS